MVPACPPRLAWGQAQASARLHVSWFCDSRMYSSWFWMLLVERLRFFLLYSFRSLLVDFARQLRQLLIGFFFLVESLLE